MSKPAGLFSIGEIAAVCGVSVDTLHCYEAKALIESTPVEEKELNP